MIVRNYNFKLVISEVMMWLHDEVQLMVIPKLKISSAIATNAK